MTNLQTFKVCQGYAQAMCTCTLLDQEELADQFLDKIYCTLQGTPDIDCYVGACIICKSSNMQAAADSVGTDALEQHADFAEYLASLFATFTTTVDTFITVMRFAVACLDEGLYDAHPDGWLVCDMVNHVFADAVLHGDEVTFVADSRAIALLNSLMEKL